MDHRLLIHFGLCWMTAIDCYYLYNQRGLILIIVGGIQTMAINYKSLLHYKTVWDKNYFFSDERDGTNENFKKWAPSHSLMVMAR